AVLENFLRIEAIPSEVLNEVLNSYRTRHNHAQERLDVTAEQFPEFVNHLQEALGRRLILFSEVTFIESQQRAGTLPESVGDPLVEELQSQMETLRGYELGKLKTSPEELLRTVPFLRDLPFEDFSVLATRLRPQTAAG